MTEKHAHKLAIRQT